MKKKPEPKWIYAGNNVRIPLMLIRHDVWKSLTYAAVALYIYMRASIKDPDNGFRNTDEARVKFGPADVRQYGMSKGTYYRALEKLLELGIIEEVEPGFHGRRGVYNLLALDWIDYETKEGVPIYDNAEGS